MANRFRISDLWWDDRSPLGRLAIWVARKRNHKLVMRRSPAYRRMSYDEFCGALADKMFAALIVMAKIAVGLFALVALGAVWLLVYALVS